MSIVGSVLRRPYTVAAVSILVCLPGVGAAERMPVEIFPEMDIPGVSVVWTYNGMRAEDIQDRILSLHQRQLGSLVDDISRIETTSRADPRAEVVEALADRKQSAEIFKERSS
jgi:multidrug efflux pump subunit AcrB